MNDSISSKLFNEAKKVIPGGVNSPVRAFKSVGRDPIFIKKASGAYIYDEDENRYIDYVGSWGPAILGHADQDVLNKINETAKNGTSFGAPTHLEVKLANLVIDAVKSVEEIRMVSSGTEATMSAIRVARGYTEKDKIIKFEGCYHGHADSLLVKAGSGGATFAVPDSEGVPKDLAKHTLVATYNSIDSVKKLISENKNEIACLIIEPVAGNMGTVLPDGDFLKELREVCSEENIVLIFDEVMTGFRVAYGGVQSLHNISPDMTTFGKIIGGGLPVGAFGGKKEIMEKLAPNGAVYQAGTLSGNPLAMSAGIATLEKIKSIDNFYKILEEKTVYLTDNIKNILKKQNLNYYPSNIGSMFCLFFTDKKVTNWQTASTSDTKLYAKYFNKMLESGLYIAPSQFETLFVSYTHTKDDLDKTAEIFEKVLKEIQQ